MAALLPVDFDGAAGLAQRTSRICDPNIREALLRTFVPSPHLAVNFRRLPNVKGRIHWVGRGWCIREVFRRYRDGLHEVGHVFIGERVERVIRPIRRTDEAWEVMR